MAEPNTPTDPDIERVKSIHNERTKLLATYLNGLAIAIVVVGVFSPAFTASQGASPAGLAFQYVQIGLCLLMSLVLHFTGRLTLGTLR